jgi:hypothetical protein
VFVVETMILFIFIVQNMFTSFAVCLQEEHHLLNHLLTHVIYHVSFLLELFISRSWHENAKLLLLLLNSYPTCKKKSLIIYMQ